jgi:hypothetical protein
MSPSTLDPGAARGGYVLERRNAFAIIFLENIQAVTYKMSAEVLLIRVIPG